MSQESRSTLSLRNELLLVVMLSVTFGLRAKDNPYRLPELAAGPSSLFASKHRTLFVQSGTEVLVLDLAEGRTATWKESESEGRVEIMRSGSGDVVARVAEEASVVFYCLKGARAEKLLEYRSVENGPWYVDALGRVWLQGEEALSILQKGKEPQIIKRQRSRHGPLVRRPCEWRPGHVVLFYGLSMIWATPEKIRVRKLPPFVNDGTGKGPLRLGEHFLVFGGSVGRGHGSYVIDTRFPDAPARPLRLGWEWFYPVASAPDGRVLVRSEIPREKRASLFWYAPDGKSQVQLRNSEGVLRAGVTRDVCFDAQGLGYMCLKDGTLAVLEADQARVITPLSGLPLEGVRHLAMAGDELVLADDAGNVVLWDTRIPFKSKELEELNQRDRWRLSGPCCVDVDGDLWAFLLDVPGHVSRFDGQRWTHLEVDLGNKRPFVMTADDTGGIQIGLMGVQNLLLRKGHVRSWEQEPRMAWKESVRLGAKRFFDGSGQRTTHWTDGSGRIWFCDGRTLWDGKGEIDYRWRPGYRRWWVGQDGAWYRDGNHLMVYRAGRWRHSEEAPRNLRLGPNGLCSYNGKLSEEQGDQFLEVDYYPPGQLVVHGRQARATSTIDQAERVSQHMSLTGEEIYLKAKSGGGWVGQTCYFEGIFFPLENVEKVYETPYGRFLLQDDTIALRRRTDLKITARSEESEDGSTVRYKLHGAQESGAVRVLVLVDGSPRLPLETSGEVHFPAAQYAGRHIQLWAIDDAGNVSSAPAAIELTRTESTTGKDGDAALAQSEARPQWQSVSTNVQIAGDPYQLARSMATGADGTVFVTARKARASSTIVLGLDDKAGVWFRVAPADRGRYSSCILSNSPGGGAWAVVGSAERELECLLLSLNKSGARLAARLYDEKNRGRPLLAWDHQGGLWNVGLRWMGRWQRGQWQEWERRVGGRVQIHPGSGGRVTIVAPGRLWVYSDGELIETRGLPSALGADLPCYPLGERHLVLRCRPEQRRGEAWGLYDLARGVVDLEALSDELLFCPDGKGNLFCWNRQTSEFYLISGSDLTRTELPYTPPKRGWKSGCSDLFLTREGEMIYPVGLDTIIVWSRDKGPVKHGWRCGIQPGMTHAIREGNDGRIWILRDKQLLVYDPRGNPRSTRASHKTWDEIEFSGWACAGFAGQLWYWAADGTTVVCTDGEEETRWRIEERASSGRTTVEVVSNKGEALVKDSTGLTQHLRADGSFKRVEDVFAGILLMIRKGARAFRSRDYPPAVSADARVYYDGRLWDGERWRGVHRGRGSFRGDGALVVIINAKSYLPHVWRFMADKVEDLGKPKRYQIDEHGIRWYDPRVAGKGARRYPLAIGEEPGRGHDIYLTPESEPVGYIQYPVKAVPDGRNGFIVMDCYLKLHHVSPDGIRRLDGLRAPFGREEVSVYHLAGGRWAWFSKSKILLSPPDLELTDDDGK